METKVKIADLIRIRQEFFGGLIFRKNDLAIFEINDKTYELLDLIEEEKNLEDIFDYFEDKYNVDKTTFNTITDQLFLQRIIVHV
jgi:hypothetical protein